MKVAVSYAIGLDWTFLKEMEGLLAEQEKNKTKTKQ